MHNYTGPVREAGVIHWLRDRLAERLEHIADPITFETKWRDFSENSLEPEIRVVLFTHASCPPLFYSSLSVKFPGRVRFGIVKLNSPSVSKVALWKNVLQKESIMRLPAYVVYTAEGYYQYGQNPGEYLSFPNMEGFLRFLYPCLNDIFIVSFCMANIFSLLEPVTCNCGILKRLRKLIWCTFKYNIVVIMLWLPIIGIFQMPYLDNVPLALLKSERMLSTSYFGTIFRTDYTFYLNSPIYIYVSFILYLVAVTALCKRFRESEDEPDDWFNFSQMPTLAHLGPNAFIDPMRSRRNDLLGNSDFFGSGSFFQPSYWMNPVISSDYIQYLPTWRYTPIPIAELAANNATQMYSTLASDKSGSSNFQFVHTENGGVKSSQVNNSKSETCSCNCNLESQRTNALPQPHESQASHASLSQLPCKLCCSSYPSAVVSSQSSAKTDTVQCMSKFSSSQEANMTSNPCSSKIQQQNDNLQSNTEGHAASGETHICQQSRSFIHSADAAETGCQSNKNVSTTSTMACSPDPNVPLSGTLSGSPRPSGFPPGYVESHQCVICLDDYVPLTMLCGLPCGHVFHETCIFSWLNRDKHFCPMCRWPSYKLPVTAASSI